MADTFTQLKDMIVPEVFANYVLDKSLKTNRLVQSGILTNDPSLGAQLLAPGDYINMPMINDIAEASDPQPWTDTETIAVDGLNSSKQLAFKFRQAKAFGWTDISQLVSGAPNQSTIVDRYPAYWNTQDQKILTTELTGVFANTDIHTAKAYDDTTTFSARGFLAAISLLGDLQDNSLSKIAVNSATYAEMKAQQMIETIQPSEGGVPLNMYNGMRVVVDDDLPIADDGTSTSYIFGNGAVGYSVAKPQNAVEIERQARDQGGRTNIINRRVVTTHVIGTSVAKGFVPAGQTVTYAELAKGDTWDCIVDPRNIQIVQYNAKLDKEFIPKKLPKKTIDANIAKQATPTQDGLGK